MIKTYYLVMKPGIIAGNVVTTAAGFALASRGVIDWWLFLATLVGMCLVVGSGCVMNNYIDREADMKMARTKDRAIATGLISGPNAIGFGTVLGILGMVILIQFTNVLTAAMALTGFLTYVFIYGVCKYKTVYGTLIGSIAGAIPPVIGYCAVSNRLDLGALLIFLIVVVWQMPHFFAIAMFRFNDYLNAGIPVLPVKQGANSAKTHMFWYIVLFLGISITPTLFGLTGYAYFISAAVLSSIWLWMAFQGFKATSDKIWARKMFFFSLIVIMGLCAMLALDVVGDRQALATLPSLK